MTKLKLGPVETDKPVRVSVRLDAPLYRDVVAYGAAVAKMNNQATPLEPAKLIPAILQHFLATDRGFAKLKRETPSQKIP